MSAPETGRPNPSLVEEDGPARLATPARVRGGQRPRYRAGVSHRVLSVITAAAATVMLVFGVAGHSRISGPVILRFGQTTHGVHLDDLVVLGCWLVALAMCLRLWRRG